MLDQCVESEVEGFFPTSPLPLTGELRERGLPYWLVVAAPSILATRERVRQGAEQLARSFPDVPMDATAVEESLAAGLLEPLLTMMARAIVLELNVARLEHRLEGDTPQERFRSFLQLLVQPEFAREFFAEYPVLIDRINHRLERWMVISLELLQHLCEDWNALLPWFGNSSPGPLVAVQGGAGDTHRGGRSVLILGFANGDRLVYKPRSLAADEHFQQTLEWLNQRGAKPDFRLLKILDRGDHGWSEFVSPRACESEEELQRFYRRQGSYLALLHVLGACDFHGENLIAAGEYPLLIDLEALFHARSWQAPPRNADESAAIFLSSSSVGVGLLPSRMWANTDAGIDLSGLGSAAGQLSPEPLLCWEGMDTDEMRLMRKHAELPGFSNRPTLHGAPANAMDYAESIASGFASTYRLLLERRAEFRAVLPWFAEDEVRVIVRPTRAYAALYQESFHPDLLRRESERLAFFDRLQEAVAFRPDLNRLIAAERRDLINGDIPLFCTRPAAQCVWDSSHERIDNYFDEPGMAVAERRLAQLSENDLERQLWVVRASLATLAAHTDGPLNQVPCSSRKPLPTSAGELLAAAMQIGNRLADLALTTDDESTWIGLEIAAHDQWSLSPLATDLYDGLPGVILFLAYLGELSQDARYSRLANSALNALRRRTHQGEQTKQIGAFSGLGGMIYLATHLGVLWKDAALLSEAEEFAASIPALVEHDTVLDVIGGAAGCALALSGLYKSRGSARTLEASRTCGEHLLRTAQPMETGIAWLCSNQTTPLLAGFAHGNAGIAYALFELAAATGDARFYHAATQAVTYERSLYCDEVRNWRDLRAHAAGGFTTAWCHGAPGIGLARLYSLRHCGDALVRGEIAAALATTSVAESGGNHSLCHGELGNGDILLSAAEILQDARWRLRAEQMAAGALAVARERGWVCANPLGVGSPGLMTGLAGVGYALLRLAAPVPIPSLLALEPPVLP